MALMETETNRSNMKSVHELVVDENIFHLDDTSVHVVEKELIAPTILPQAEPLLDDQLRHIVKVPYRPELDEYFTKFAGHPLVRVMCNQDWEAVKYAWVHGRMPDGRRTFKALLSSPFIDDEERALFTELSSKRNISPTWLILSRNPVDLLMCSTHQSWKSCLNLESDYEKCYYMGIPWLLANPHAFLVFQTTGKLRRYELFNHTIKHFRMLARVWAFSKDGGRFCLVNRKYPYNPGFTAMDPGYLFLTDSWAFEPIPLVKDLYFEDGEDIACRPYLDCGFRELNHDVYKHGSYVPDFNWNNKEGIEEIMELNRLPLCSCCDNTCDEDYYTIDDEPVCYDCCREYYTYCDGCDEYHHNDNTSMWETNNGWYCTEWLEENNYHFCPNCETWHE